MPISFPSIPVHENLFDSNELLEQYWERSTSNRDSTVRDDGRTEEVYVPALPSEYQELEDLTVRAFGDLEHVDAPAEPVHIVEEILVESREVPVVVDAIVKPLTESTSGLSSGQILALTILIILALWILVVLLNNWKPTASLRS